MNLATRISAAAVLALALAIFVPGAADAEGIASDLPESGIALVAWDGGSVDVLAETNPTVRSVWIAVGGTLLGYQVGAPGFVNGDFLDAFPAGELEAGTPLLAVVVPKAEPIVAAFDAPVWSIIRNAEASGFTEVGTDNPVVAARSSCSSDESTVLGWGHPNASSVQIVGIGVGECVGWRFLFSPSKGAYYWLEDIFFPPSGPSAPSATPTPAPTTSCHPSYPGVCIPPAPPDLDCGDIAARNFAVVGSDPHGFDGDNDGVGCEE